MRTTNWIRTFVLVACVSLTAAASADTMVDFENPPYTQATILGQDGWSTHMASDPGETNVVANPTPAPPGGNGSQVLEFSGSSFVGFRRLLGPVGAAGTETYSSGIVQVSFEIYYPGSDMADGFFFQGTLAPSSNYGRIFQLGLRDYAEGGPHFQLQGANSAQLSAMTGSARWIELWAELDLDSNTVEAGWVEAGGTKFGTPLLTDSISVDSGGFQGVYAYKLGSSTFYVDDIGVAVPEPTSMALLLFGGASMLIRRRMIRRA